jgi:Fe-S-cluster-containing hydrogenase component 2
MGTSTFIVADSSLCIGCETCMAVCILQHLKPGDVGQPRLRLTKTRTISAPIACHQCDDAPCIAACPTGALYHDGNRVAVRSGRCIGCYSCMMACRYGAIDVVGAGRKEVRGDMRDNPASPMPLKCDLCGGRPEGPACVSSCLNDALKVVEGNVRNQPISQQRLAAASRNARGKDAASRRATTRIPLNRSLAKRPEPPAASRLTAPAASRPSAPSTSGVAASRSAAPAASRSAAPATSRPAASRLTVPAASHPEAAVSASYPFAR